MADDVKTLREASIHFGNVATRLNVMTGVFVATVAVAGAAYWNTDSKLTRLGDAVSAIQTSSAVQAEQLKTVNQTLDQIRTALTRSDPYPTPIIKSEGDAPHLALFGLESGKLILAFKKVSPPDEVTFFVTTPNNALRAALAGRLEGAILPSGAVSFKGPMLYELPYAIEALKASAADQVQLSANDPQVMTSIIDAIRAG